jgi:hypothetical protein
MRRLIPTSFALGAVLLLAVSVCMVSVEAGSQPGNGHTPALPLKPNSVRFAVIGDSGSGDSAEYEVAQQMQRLQESTKFNFVIMVGDNLYGGSAPKDYEDRFARPFKPLLDGGVKFYASLGNHDNVNEVSYAPFNMNGNRYYTHIEGDVEFFVLDSNYMDGRQLEWLKSELQKSTSPWRIAFFHHPLYSSGKRHGSDTDLRAVLEPMFRQYGVNVVLSGHDHVYERVAPQNGIYYFVMGSSGQLRSGGLGSDSLRAAGFDTNQCFMVIEITGDEFYFRTVSRKGEIVDSGMYKRQQPQATGAQERGPGLPAQ